MDDDAPALPLVTVSLSITVPGEEAGAASARLGATLTQALVDGASFSRASLDLFVNEDEEPGE